MNKLNFCKAYATYCAYCKRCKVNPLAVQEFSEMWNSNKTSNHVNCNYNYLED